MRYPDDWIRHLFPEGWVGPTEFGERLDGLRRRGLRPSILSDLYRADSVPMLERVEAMTDAQIADLNEAAVMS